MSALDRIDQSRHAHVLGRLQQNVIAWFTSVTPDGRPECIPVWFLWREDETILVYSQPTAHKLTNIVTNPKVSLVLDVSDLGRDLVRVTGTAARSNTHPPAARNEPYLAKYAERIAALFGSPERFSELFSEAVVITPKRLYSPPPSAGVVLPS